MSVNETIFSSRRRATRCRNKDAVIRPIIEGLQISSPREFHALLMPCIQGPELSILEKKGVPPENIWAIEGKAPILAEMRKRLKVNLLPKAMRSDEALWYIEAQMVEEGKKFDLIYLDYFSQPQLEHCEVLEYVFARRMLASKGLLILNFGKNRCADWVKEINESLEAENGLPTKDYVDTVLRECAKNKKPHPMYNRHEERTYRSGERPGAEHMYVTSVFWF